MMPDKEQEVRWTISNRTAIPIPSTISGVGFSPKRENCIVLYLKLPDEVGHLHFPVRRPTLEALFGQHNIFRLIYW